MKQKVLQFVEHLRAKPEETRKHILTVAMIIVGIVLVLIWIATLNIGTSNDLPEKQSDLSKDAVRPFELVKDNFSSTLDTVKVGISGLKEDFSSVMPQDNQQTDEQTVSGVPITATGDSTTDGTVSQTQAEQINQ